MKQNLVGLFVILGMALCLVACGNNDSVSNQTAEEGDNEQEFAVDENIGQLEAEGYSKVSDIAYAKIEGEQGDETVYLNYYTNAPKTALYTVSKFQDYLGDCRCVIKWNGKEYDTDEWNKAQTEDEFVNMLPTEWQEIAKGMLVDSNGADNLVTTATSEAIDTDVKNIVEKYQETLKAESENQEASEAEEDSDTEIIDTFEYEYDENNKVVVAIASDTETDKISISVFGNYGEENKGLLQCDFSYICACALAESIDMTFGATVGEEYYMYMMKDGVIVMNTVPLDDMLNVPEQYEEQVKECVNGINDLLVRNGLQEKTYNTPVYEDENVKITFTGVDDKGVNFIIDNLTDYTITIQARTISINGISTNSIIMSDEVAAQSKGTVTAQCSDFSSVNEFETITGELRIISDAWTTYSANFVNVEIK